MMMQHRPSSAFNSPFFTTNSGAPVWNNNSSMTVGPRGIWTFYLCFFFLWFIFVIDVGFLSERLALLRCWIYVLHMCWYSSLSFWLLLLSLIRINVNLLWDHHHHHLCYYAFSKNMPTFGWICTFYSKSWYGCPMMIFLM